MHSHLRASAACLTSQSAGSIQASICYACTLGQHDCSSGCGSPCLPVLLQAWPVQVPEPRNEGKPHLECTRALHTNSHHLPVLQMRPSRRATWKRNNRISLMRYR